VSWFRRNRPPVRPSREAVEAIAKGDRDLAVAHQRAREAKEVASSLSASHDVNHYAIALAAVLRGGN
jgi:hypothetical protein